MKTTACKTLRPRIAILALPWLMALTMFAADAAAQQEPIRIDRPRDGDAVSAEFEVAGVATPGSTIEVWVDRVFVVDTVAEPDGWYVARVRKPPNAPSPSRIFAHELNAKGERVSSAVVRVTWSSKTSNDATETDPQPADLPDDPNPDDPDVPDTVTKTTDPTKTGERGPDGQAITRPERTPATSRAGRIVVGYLASFASGVTGAMIGVGIAGTFTDRNTPGRDAASLILGALGGGFASGAAVYGVGTAMEGNGKFIFSAIGGLAGSFLVIGVALGAGPERSALVIPVGMVALSFPVIGYELSSDVSRFAPKIQPTVTPEGDPGVTLFFRW